MVGKHRILAPFDRVIFRFYWFK